MRGMYSEDLSENRSPENRSRAGDIKMQKALLLAGEEFRK
jgi:hypothetical protein